ncbi:unnamed protein product [Rotaria magnacalcarata]|uniref:Cyclic nucleotide-binding domain-containing protein n=1 Tax=Rotaria magnacalcarata TaxID=392030 RepID=A0A816LQS9_9BILA|nr:unnamed protein product [Rotaria magnacalcarata]CAF3792036.1 unnamed protein product [Rotaria magnacalcarata]
MAANSSDGIDPSEFYINSDQADHSQFELADVDNVKSGKLAVILKSVNIFKHLDDNKLLDVADSFTVQNFQSGAHIVKLGKKANCVAGVHQTRKNDQTLHEIFTLRRLDYVGAVDIFFNREYSSTVKAKMFLSCTNMNHVMFDRLIKPILEDIQSKAEEYKTFMNLCLKKRTI